MIQRLRGLPPPLKALTYAAVALVMFAVATGVGAMAALLLGPDFGSPGGESRQEAGSPGSPGGAQPQKAGGGENAAGESQQEANSPEGAQPQKASEDKNATNLQEEATAEQSRGASRQDEAEYVGTVGEIQARAVKAFLDSHNKLLRYDALTAADVEEMQANQTALEKMNEQTGDLVAPRKYEEQYEVFSAAIDELQEATRLAYGMAADPVAAAEQGFDEYDGSVNEASGLLRRSNELLNREYKAIENVREVSPEF